MRLSFNVKKELLRLSLLIVASAFFSLNTFAQEYKTFGDAPVIAGKLPALSKKVLYESDKKFYLKGFDPAKAQVIAEPSIFANTSEVDGAIKITNDVNGFWDMSHKTGVSGELYAEAGIFRIRWDNFADLAIVQSLTPLDYTLKVTVVIWDERAHSNPSVPGWESLTKTHSGKTNDPSPLLMDLGLVPLTSGRAYLRLELQIDDPAYVGFGGVQDYALNVRTSHLVKTVVVRTPEGTVGDPEKVNVGDTLIYTIAFGTLESVEIQWKGLLHDTIPTGTTYVPNSITAHAGITDKGYIAADNIVYWKLDQLNTNTGGPPIVQDYSFKVVVDNAVAAGTNIANIAYIVKTYPTDNASPGLPDTIKGIDNSAMDCQITEVSVLNKRITAFKVHNDTVCYNGTAVKGNLYTLDASLTPASDYTVLFYENATGGTALTESALGTALSNLTADKKFYISVKKTTDPSTESLRKEVTITVLNQIKITAIDTRPDYNFDCTTPTTGTGAIFVTATGHSGLALEYSINATTWQDDFKFENLPGKTYTVDVRYKKYATCKATETAVVATSVVSDTTSYSYGDAPASYKVASHRLKDCLYFGAKPESSKVQLEAVHSILANTAGNDNGLTGYTTSKIDFSGTVPAYISLSAAGDLTIKTTIVNGTGATVHTAAWIDFGHESEFKASGKVVGTITGNNVEFKWLNVKDKLRHGVTYLRMRVSTEAITTPDGALKDGEVEDYMLDFDLYSINKTIETKRSSDTAYVGENVTYKIEVENKLPYKYTFNITDTIPNKLAPVSPLTGTAVGADSTAYSWTLTDLAASTAETISAKLTVKELASGVIADTLYNIAYLTTATKDTLNSSTENCELARVILQEVKLLANDDCAMTFADATKGLLDVKVTANDTISGDVKPYTLTVLPLTLVKPSGATATAPFVVKNLNDITFTPETGVTGIYSIKYVLTSTKVGITLADTAVLTMVVVNSGADTLCAGSTGNVVSIAAVPGVTFEWFKEDGTAAAVGGHTGISSPSFTMPLARDTSFYISAKATAANCDTVYRMQFKIKLKAKATAANIVVPNDTVCHGDVATLNVITPVAGATYKWYETLLATTPIHTGTSFVTNPLKTDGDTIFYVSISSPDICENDPSARKAVTVTVADTFKIKTTVTPTECETGNTGTITIEVEQGGYVKAGETSIAYSYELDGTTVAFPTGSNIALIQNLSAKTHAVKIIANGDCSKVFNITVVGGFDVDTAFARSYSDAPLSYGIASHKIEKCVYLGGLDVNKIQPMPIPSDSANTALNDDGIKLVSDSKGYTDFKHATSSLKITADSTITLDVKTVGAGAWVAGWIDFNRDGKFTPDEFVKEPVVVAGGQTVIQWTKVANRLRKGETYMRLRITADRAITSADVTTYFQTGEVEDYLLNFNPYDITKTAESVNTRGDSEAYVGDSVRYTITVNKYVPYALAIDRVYDTINTHLGSPTSVQIPAYGSKSPVADSAILWERTPNGIIIPAAKTDSTFIATIPVVSIPKDSLQYTVYNIAYAKIGLDTINSASEDCELTQIVIKPVPVQANDDCLAIFQNANKYEFHPLVNDTVTSLVTMQVELVQASLHSMEASKKKGVTKVGRGAIEIDATDSTKFYYTPVTGWTGIDSLQYRLGANGVYDTATVRIAVVKLDIDGTKYTFCPAMDTAIKVDLSSWSALDISQVKFVWLNGEGKLITGATNPRLPIKTGPSDSVYHVGVILNHCDTDTTFLKIDVSVDGKIPAVTDFMLNVCPAPGREIHLTSYVDLSPFYKGIKWEKLGAAPAMKPGTDLTTGTILSGNLTAPGLYLYSYELDTYCGKAPKAKAYVTAITDGTVIKDTTKVLVCIDDASKLNLLSMLRLEADGKWFYAKSPTKAWEMLPAMDPANPVKDYITVQNGISGYTGLFFDGGSFYDAVIATPALGEIINIDEVKVVFEYRVPASSGCLAGEKRMLEIILTPRIVN